MWDKIRESIEINWGSFGREGKMGERYKIIIGSYWTYSWRRYSGSRYGSIFWSIHILIQIFNGKWMGFKDGSSGGESFGGNNYEIVLRRFG